MNQPADLPFNPRKRHIYREAYWEPVQTEASTMTWSAWRLEQTTQELEQRLARIPLWLAVWRWVAR